MLLTRSLSVNPRPRIGLTAPIPLDNPTYLLSRIDVGHHHDIELVGTPSFDEQRDVMDNDHESVGSPGFLVDPVGRYSGLADFQPGADGKVAVEVVCEGVADALRAVLAAEGRIDLVKVDTEGSEEAIIAAIPADVRAAIGEIVHEYPGGVRHLRP